jgi:hypothetical protein
MTFNNWKRVLKHKRYVNNYLRDLRWELINTCLLADKMGWTMELTVSIQNQTKLIRKYERRRRLLSL